MLPFRCEEFDATQYVSFRLDPQELTGVLCPVIQARSFYYSSRLTTDFFVANPPVREPFYLRGRHVGVCELAAEEADAGSCTADPPHAPCRRQIDPLVPFAVVLQSAQKLRSSHIGGLL